MPWHRIELAPRVPFCFTWHMAHRYTRVNRHKVRRHGRSYYLGRRIGNPDWKIIGLAALVGVAGTVGSAYAQANVSFFKTNWYALPLTFGLGAILLLGKMPVIGVGLAVFAGALAYAGYPRSTAAPASGFGEAGAFYGARRDSGLYEGMGALVGGGGRIAGRHQGAVGTLLGAGSRAARTHQGAVGAMAGYGEAGGYGALGLD